MTPTPIQVAQSLIAIHHHGINGDIIYKESELIPLLTSWGIPNPDWDGCAKEHYKFEQMLRELYLVSHPADTIQECLEEKNMTLEQLAQATGLELSYLQKIMDKEFGVTKGTAVALELALGIDRQFWINRQANYNKKMAEANKEYESQKNSTN